MLSGEYNHNIDAKGRLIIPSKFRSQLGDTVVITKGIEHCLLVFTEKDWSDFTLELRKLPRSSKTRNYLRYTVGSADEVAIDKMGRVLLSPSLRQHAFLDKDVVLVGVLDRIEIWDKETWDRQNDEVGESIEDITEELTEQGFNI